MLLESRGTSVHTESIRVARSEQAVWTRLKKNLFDSSDIPQLLFANTFSESLVIRFHDDKHTRNEEEKNNEKWFLKHHQTIECIMNLKLLNMIFNEI